MNKAMLLGSLLVILSCAVGAGMRAAESAAPAPASVDVLSGKVLETMDAAGYTYVLIDTGTQKVWFAAPQFAIKAGDAVTAAAGTPMANYRSKTLQRTFDVVYFTGNVLVNGTHPAGPAAATAGLPAGHPPTDRMQPALPDLTGIKRAQDGQTVAEIHAGKAALAGKQIAVRGRVVKFNAMILGKNWLHIRDGSGENGTNDLTVTTTSAAKVGDLVLVTGELHADKDFGSGYRYGLIVEDAKVVVETP